LQTILEEFSFEPAVFKRGRFTFVEPMSGADPHRFPDPVGTRRPFFTLHSEVATLPLSFRERGVKEVTFKIAFDDDFIDRVRFLRDMGFGSHRPIRVRDCEVRPIELANRVAMSQEGPKRVGPLKQYEIVRTVVKGKQGKKKVTVVADCHTTGMPSWGIGTDVNTGCPPAIAAQMLAAEEISASGALPPEKAVPPGPFFERLSKRRMPIKVSRRSGWEFPV
jgi:saccharopine dehydrogenase (NAD+, L-lysine-forming)